MSAYEFLSQLLIDKFDVPADKITPEASLQELGMDSLSVVELVFDTGSAFEIQPDYGARGTSRRGGRQLTHSRQGIAR